MKTKKKTLLIISSSLIIVIIAASLIGVFVLNKDENAPAIQINSPLPAEIVSGAFTISITAEDDKTPEKRLLLEIFVDNELKSTHKQFSWDTTEYEDGSHQIEVKVLDKRGNEGRRTLNVTVDNVKHPTSTDVFKIMTYNIKESGIFSEWKDVVKEENADIIVFVETGDWDNSGDRLLHDALNEFNDYFSEENPYIGETVQGETYSTSGEAIFSRYHNINFTQISNLTLDSEEQYYPTHDFFHASVDINGWIVQVIGSHLKASTGELNEGRREYEQEGIINYMDALGDVPIIYAGDFNCHSPFDLTNFTVGTELGYGPLAMLLSPEDPIYGQYASEIHNFTDVHRTLNPTDPGYSFGPNNPSLTGRIDFIITNQHFEGKLINSTTGDTSSANDGSDHFTVDAFISLEENLPEQEKSNFIYEEKIHQKKLKNNSERTKIVLSVQKLRQTRRIQKKFL